MPSHTAPSPMDVAASKEILDRSGRTLDLHGAEEIERLVLIDLKKLRAVTDKVAGVDHGDRHRGRGDAARGHAQ